MLTSNMKVTPRSSGVNAVNWAPTRAITRRRIRTITSNRKIHQGRATERLEEGRDDSVCKSCEEIDVGEKRGLDLAWDGVEDGFEDEAEAAVCGGGDAGEMRCQPIEARGM